MTVKNFSHLAYSKNLIIEIPDYKFNHHPLGESIEDEDSERYIGRDKIRSQFLSYLENGSKKGAYLISGYRGMGKTSFVKKTVSEYKERNPKKHIKTIELSFTQNNLSEEDILKQLTQGIIAFYEEKSNLLKIWKTLTLSNIIQLIFFLIALGVVYYEISLSETGLNNFKKNIQYFFTISDTNSSILSSSFSIKLAWLVFYIACTSYVCYFTLKLFYKIFRISQKQNKHFIAWYKRNKETFTSLRAFTLFKGQTNLGFFKKVFQFFFQAILCLFKLPILGIIWLILLLSQLAAFFIQILSDDDDIEIYKQLIDLRIRSNSSTTEEQNIDVTSLFKRFPFSIFTKKSKTLPIINAKDIENELIEILKSIKRVEFIVIFDELDKIEHKPDWKIQNPDENSQSSGSYKEQKATVITILASLKYFITEAKARFIFIAGREMFDAALADIADRQSFISSIFHHVIYVDSFLKDTPTTYSTGISHRVEEYLGNILLSNIRPKELERIEHLKGETLLRRYFAYLQNNVSDNLKIEDILKVIYVLQNFIIYITYRSNGSAKKMSRIIEEHIKPSPRAHKDFNSLEESFKYIEICHDIHRSNRPGIKPANSHQKEVLCLCISYDEQYRNAYITYLFRPFLLNFSNYAKRLSDKILVAMPFLIDHILKFHPFAFSIENLELLPEVISSNKNPMVRGFIGELIDYLSQNHLEKTEMGLFDFRFNKKTSDELNFISKVFEEESAAFNFSLDEMHTVKTYLQNRINSTKAKYNNNRVVVGKDETVYSLALMESLLGDTFYFDKEYDLAISSYLDSLQTLRVSEGINTLEVFFSIIRLKLKIGLMYELIKKYDLSLSYYYDAINYFLQKLREQKADDEEGAITGLYLAKKEMGMHLFSKAAMSLLTVTEKKNYDGLSQTKITEMNSLLERIMADENYPKMALSDYHNDLGTLLFYKNHVPEISEAKKKKVSAEYLIPTLLFRPFSSNSFDHTKVLSDNKDYRPALVTIGEYKRSLTNLLYPTEVHEILEDYKEEIEATRKKIGSYNFAFSYNNDKIKNEVLTRICLSKLLLINAKRIFKFKNEHIANYLKLSGYTLSSLGDFLFSINVNPVSELPFLEKWGRVYQFINNYSAHVISEINKGRDFSRSLLLKILIEQKLDFPFEGIEHFYKKSLMHDNNIKEGKLEKFIMSYLRNEIHITSQTRIKYDDLKVRPLKFWDVISYLYFKKYDKEGGSTQFISLKGIDSAKIHLKKTTEFFELEFIIFTYYLSARYYSKCGLDNSFSTNLRKIIETLFNHTDSRLPAAKHDEEKRKYYRKKLYRISTFFENSLIKMMLEASSWNSDSTDRPQMHKFKYYQNIEYRGNKIFHPEEFKRFNYTNLSNSSEVKEVILSLGILRLKFYNFRFKPIQKLNFKKDPDKFIKDKFPEISLLSQYHSPGSQYSRLLEMNLQSRINRLILKSLLLDEFDVLKKWETEYYSHLKKGPEINIKATNGKSISSEFQKLYNDKFSFNFLCEIVASSIYLHFQIIKTYKIFQNNPYLSYSSLAFFHKRLGRWLKYYALCRIAEAYSEPTSIHNTTYRIDEKLNALVGTHLSLISLDATSQYQIALKYLHKAKQFHSNGMAYQKDIDSRIYLEGDYEDLIYNFGIAIERNKINSGEIRREIKELEQELHDSPLDSYRSFISAKDFSDYLERLNQTRETET